MPISDEFAVNVTEACGYQGGIDFGQGDSWLAVWPSCQDGLAVRRYQDLLQPEWPELRVTPAEYDWGPPSVFFRRDGTASVVWEGFGPSTSEGQRIFGRLIGATGEPISNVFLISQAPNLSVFQAKLLPSVAGLADGSFFVVWHDEGGDLDGSGAGIFGRLFEADGTPRTDEFQINQFTDGDQIEPEIASDGHGRYVVAWTSDGIDESGFGVAARLFDGRGAPLGDQFLVNLDHLFDEWRATVSMDSAGNFLIGWEDQGHAPEPGRDIYYGETIWGRLYDRNGEPISGELLLSSSSDSTNELPSVALSDAGVAIAAWQSYVDPDSTPGIRAREFTLPCFADGRTVCVRGDRFLVRVDWATANGEAELASARQLTDESAAFTFFSDANLEIFVKVLDGCGTNDRFWVYATGLTNVGVTVTVTDRWTGHVWSHVSPLGAPFPPVQDIEAFSGCGLTPPAPVLEFPDPVRSDRAQRVEKSLARTPAREPSVGAAGGSPADGCVAGASALCLRAGRFRVEASFATLGGLAGEAQAVALSDESGYFWFFWPANPELFVKVLDACVPFARYWVFAAGLTDVEVELRVEDTWTGQVASYPSGLGTPFSPIEDLASFGSCPQ